jgi:FkbM family methyltransferase
MPPGAALRLPARAVPLDGARMSNPLIDALRSAKRAVLGGPPPREAAYSRSDLDVCKRLLRSGIEPRCIVDAGANIGQFALAATTVWPGIPIHSFEPLPAALAGLRDLASRHPHILPSGCALGAEPGTAKLRVTSYDLSSSLLPLHAHHRELYPDITETDAVEVEVRTLAQIVPELSGPDPRLLKLDVQGFEHRVLAGAGPDLAAFRWILLETSTTPMYEGEILFDDLNAFLRGRGFRFRSPVHIHPTPAGGIGQFDALFERIAPELPGDPAA